jgi:hypothetical protein
MSSISETWGTTPDERRRPFPCDDIISQPDAALYRGLTINAPAETLFRWLCQLRIAPYSYDWIDNGGRPSPRNLTPGLEDLAIGQDVMRIFELTAFQKDHHLTLRLKPHSPTSRTFGDIAVSYVIEPSGEESWGNRCRLLVKLIARYPDGLRGRAIKIMLPWGDLIMMRRQLLNLKKLAEQGRP